MNEGESGKSEGKGKVGGLIEGTGEKRNEGET